MRGEGREGAKDDSRFLERTFGTFGRVGIASDGDSKSMADRAEGPVRFRLLLR